MFQIYKVSWKLIKLYCIIKKYYKNRNFMVNILQTNYKSTCISILITTYGSLARLQKLVFRGSQNFQKSQKTCLNFNYFILLQFHENWVLFGPNKLKRLYHLLTITITLIFFSSIDTIVFHKN